jgi:hypothetical protein
VVIMMHFLLPQGRNFYEEEKGGGRKRGKKGKKKLKKEGGKVGRKEGRK